MSAVDMFDKALSSMSGEDKTSSGYLPKEEVLRIINGAILLVQTEDKMSSIEKLNKVFKLVLDEGYTREKLNEITGASSKTQEINEPVKLSRLQSIRFRDRDLFNWGSYEQGEMTDEVVKIAREIVRDFPKAPDLPIVYNDADGATAFFSSYIYTWKTHGIQKGEAYAWAYNGYAASLIYFFDNIFVDGIMLDNDSMDSIIRCLETGDTCETYIANSDTGTDIVFKCKKESGLYSLYVNEYKIMSLKREVLERVCNTVIGENILPQGVINRVTMDLKIGGNNGY